MMMRLKAWTLAASLAASAAFAQESKPVPEPKPAQIDRNGVLILVRSTLLALDDANKTGNYSVLRDLAAPGFQQVNNDAGLAEIFAAQRKGNLDLSGVAVLEPQLTVLPQIEANGMMRMAGFFPSVPTQVNFDLLYAPVNRQWRPMGLSISLGQTAPVAPPSPAPAAPAEQPNAPKPEGQSQIARGAGRAPVVKTRFERGKTVTRPTRACPATRVQIESHPAVPSLPRASGNP
jgi:hypothetical protein